MRQDLRWKGLLIFLLVAFFAAILYFNPIRQGLDLKGGIELLLEPDYRVGAAALDRIKAEVSDKLDAAGINPTVKYLGVLDSDRYEGLKYTFANADEVQRALNLKVFPQVYKTDLHGEAVTLNLNPKVDGSTVDLYVQRDPRDFPEDALKQSLAIIDNRISQASSGMAEADVRLDGKGRINVQLPGINSLKEARDLIVATGRLTFRIDNKIVLDGTDLKEVQVGLDNSRSNFGIGGYVINIEFKGKGAKQLAKITGENIGRQMAVYLDEEKLMDPVIRDQLVDGRGQINLGNASKEQVENYAFLMRSGALPISLRVVQSTEVDPTLGKEIIKQSMFAGIVGIALVIGFMILFYGVPGIMVDFALVLYAVYVLGVMALFRGVLTLPGVAGLILSVGMAVDANIIIFERIKDELRLGKRLRLAIQAGFDRAFGAILDGNITTLIAAFVLFIFGSGPIQGFAVTLAIGIIISMFTAIFITRFFLEWRIGDDPDRYAKYFGIKEAR